MNHKKVAIVTLGWREYTMKYFETFMASARAQDYPGEIKVFATDNETSGETYGLIAKTAPDAVVILNKTNDGFAKGMNDGMREALRQGYDYIAVINIHTTFEPDYISELVRAAEKDEKIGVIQGLILMPDKKTVMTLGNATHFLGFGYGEDYKRVYEPAIADGGLKDIFYPSGTSMFFRREVLEKIGVMDEEYWMYNEDQEIGWRVWLAGYKCVLAPKAVMYSDYRFKRSMAKVYWMDRNRIISLLICYKLPTILLILPAFIIMEIGQWFFAWKNGWIKDKLRVYAYFLKPRTWAYLLRARARDQGLRIVSDRVIAGQITGEIKHQEFGDWKLRLVNPVFDLYWRIVRSLMFW
ncbi:MAG: glycosyltransferase family 2 protein [Candidatus Falkowbacteria bacterium]